MKVWLLLAAYDAPGGVPKVAASNTALQNVFNVVLALAGAISVAFIVYGGIKYMVSQGDATQVRQARDAILYALIGLVIVAVAFFAVNFVIGRF